MLGIFQLEEDVRSSTLTVFDELLKRPQSREMLLFLANHDDEFELVMYPEHSVLPNIYGESNAGQASMHQKQIFVSRITQLDVSAAYSDGQNSVVISKAPINPNLAIYGGYARYEAKYDAGNPLASEFYPSFISTLNHHASQDPASLVTEEMSDYVSALLLGVDSSGNPLPESILIKNGIWLLPEEENQYKFVISYSFYG